MMVWSVNGQRNMAIFCETTSEGVSGACVY